MSVAKKPSAVVLISGSGSNLQALIEQTQAGKLDIDIALVISNNPNAFGLQRAAQAGIRHLSIDHRDFQKRVEFDAALQNEIDKVNPAMIVLAGFMRILGTEFVNHYFGRLLNIHPSLLPEFTGTNTHQRVLDAGGKWHGVSIHFVVPEVDAGPIILQGRIAVNDGDTAASLEQRIHRIEHILYPQAVQWLAQGRLTISEDKVLLDNEISPRQLQSFSA